MIRRLLLLLIFPLFSYAGNDPVSSGARESAMAGAAFTLTGPNSIFFNQAGMGFQKTMAAGVSYNNRFLIRELATSSAFFLMPFKPGVVGVSISSFGYELYRESAAGLSLGKMFGQRFSAGMKFNFISTRFGENYGSRSYFTGEAGIIAKPWKKMSVGFHIYNPMMVSFADHNDEKIPTVFNLGLDYLVGEKVLIAGGIEKDLLNDANFKFGVEYSASEKLYLRGGFTTYPASTSLGAGYIYKNLRIDLASNWHNVLGFSPSASLIFDLK